jgi:adenine deaminase
MELSMKSSLDQGSDLVKTVKGNRLNLFSGSIEPITLNIKGTKIIHIEQNSVWHDNFLIPGFVDAHIHLESSMLLPNSFAFEARKHGTLAVVADPHEIANVAGEKGIYELLDLSIHSPLYFAYMAPSCVPASPWDTSCASLTSVQVHKLLQHPQIHGLGEVMNVPGVLQEDPEVMYKIRSARLLNKPIDGHCPGLRGSDLAHYIQKGIQSDHECIDADEAREKISLGMKILIREGSAAKNLDALLPLIDQFHQFCMLCTDDLHPNDLCQGHLLPLIRRAIKAGLDPKKVLNCAILNPVQHYRLPLGLIEEGDSADFLVVDSIENLSILQSWYRGKELAEVKTVQAQEAVFSFPFQAKPTKEKDFFIPASEHPQNIIGIKDNQLLTDHLIRILPSTSSEMLPDLEQDVIRIALINRYKAEKPVCAWVKGLGLKQGAFASSVAHDSHHILVAGIDKLDMSKAVNQLIQQKGGLCASSQDTTLLLPLPVAGLISLMNARNTAKAYIQIDQQIKIWGSKLSAPWMTLSFLGLLLIPSLKLGECGLFDGIHYKWLL